MLWLARFRRWVDRWFERPAASPAPEPASPHAADDPSHGAPPVPVPPRVASTNGVREIRLALQGGGAHGAFTWGVLDRLLDESWLAFPDITGASAGALNGAMLVSGQAAGGRAGAQRALAALWDGIGDLGAMMAPFHRARDLGVPGADAVQAMLRLWSPSQLNPFRVNPLRDLLERLVDVDALRAGTPTRLQVAATVVETGRAHLFAGGDLSIDALMASACLPLLYEAVTIDGVAYWDGGYSANPPLGPLAAGDGPLEILLVQINPDRRTVAPTSAADILDRVDEITFNASLLAELRAFDDARARDRAGGRPADRLPRLTRIAMHDAVTDATAASKGSLDRAFHRALRDHGRRAADDWLRAR